MLPVSLSFAAALALFNLFLAYRVVRLRVGTDTMHGDGGNPLIRQRMRAQLNFVEYSPFVLALVALIELAGRPRSSLWAVAIVYLFARIAHAFGMDRPGSNPLRAGGILATWAVLLGLAIWALAIASHPPAAVPATRLL